MEHQWLTWAKRLDAIARTGLHYKPSDYDAERYDEAAKIAAEMLGALGATSPEVIRELIPVDARAHVTPQVDVRGAVVEDGRVLLVREKTDGLWTLPGGFADVGLSAAENTAKEIHEEANIDVRVTRLYAVRHKAKHPYPPDPRDFYKLFFLAERMDDTPPSPGAETSDVGYFGLEDLPALSGTRVLMADIEAAFEAARDPGFIVRFD